MKAFVPPTLRHLPPVNLLAPLAAAAFALAIIAASVARIDISAEEFGSDIARTGARHALALKAEEAYQDALSNEKDAMVTAGHSGIDDYASAWMTSMDHLQAAEASYQLLSDSDAAPFDAIWSAIQSYAELGQEMYRLKQDQRSTGAISISTGAAAEARGRLNALIRDEVAASGAEMARSTRGFERDIALVAGFALVLLVLPVGAATLFAARRGRPESASLRSQ